MKLKNILMLAGIALSLCFSSCSDDDGYKWGAVASGNQLQAVTFGEDNIVTMELDPVDPTNVEVKVYRDKADEAIEVAIKVLSNDEGIFNIPAVAKFAANAKECTINVSFDKAEIGKPYKFEIALDESYVNPYLSSTTTSYAFEVTRVKWNYVGKATWIDDFWYGDLFEVDLYQRDDVKTYYRFSNPYTDDYTGGGATYTPYVVVNTAGGYVSWDNAIYINTFNEDYGAELKGYFPSALDDELADDDELSFVVLNENNGIHYLNIAPYWYMDGVGGYGDEYPCYLVFPDEALPEIEGVECWWLDDGEEGGEDDEEGEEGEGEENAAE